MKYEEIDLARIGKDEEYESHLRHLCQTDLFFLAKYVLGYRDVTEKTHKEVAAFFVQKNPDLSLKEQDSIKRRLLLLPRGCFKTTFSICDTVQWILCFPDISILVMTAANNEDNPLADMFVDEVAQHFYAAPGMPTKILLRLFPEHAYDKMPKAGFKGWFESSARKQWRREPTVMGVSIEQSLSGWHFDGIKLEDIQDNRNSQTAYGRKKVRQNLFINLKMLMSWGYREATATRYGPDDVYADMIERLDPRSAKLLWKPAMQVKEEVLKRDAKVREHQDDYEWLFANLKEKDWKLFFPEFLPYDALMVSRKENPESFMSQQMNIALGNFKPLISKERMMAITLEEDDLPIDGEASVWWRFELGDCKHAAGGAGIVEEGRMFVMDLVRGQFSPSTLAKEVVEMCKRNHANRVSIEDTPGARYMESAIRNEAIREYWPVDITWVEFQQDVSSRSLRIKSMEPDVKNNRVFFSGSLQEIVEAHRQIHLYGLVEDFEIADVVSRLCGALPKTIQAGAGGEALDTVDWELLRQRDRYDRTHGLGMYAAQEPEISEEEDVAWEPEPDSHGLESMMPGLES